MSSTNGNVLDEELGGDVNDDNDINKTAVLNAELVDEDAEEQKQRDLFNRMLKSFPKAMAVEAAPHDEGNSQNHRCNRLQALLALALLMGIAVGVTFLVSRNRTDSSHGNPGDDDDETAILVDERGCFLTRDSLLRAIDAYLDQNENDQQPEVAPITGANALPIGDWCVNLVQDLSGIFDAKRNPAAATFVDADLAGWDVSNATTLAFAFRGTERFYDVNNSLSEWNIQRVTSLHGTFWESGFNGDVSKWNTSSVRDMEGLFYRNHFFNTDISNWDTR